VPPAAIREPAVRAGEPLFTERHLQCVWFDTALRPAVLTSERGEAVTVEDPGIWNLEAGPDFVGAVIRVGPEQRRISGDVEIHVHASDWGSHGHSNDPRYNRVRIHVTHFPGTVPIAALPAGTIQIALKNALAANPHFDFDAVDVTAYPHAARPKQTRCFKVLAGSSPDAKGALLDSAGEERMRRKAERLAFAMGERDADQVLYEEVLAALGYKHNKAPFRRLAERVPLSVLRETSDRNAQSAYVILMGAAGLLPQRMKASWDAETRAFVRSMWDVWWKKKERWQSGMLTLSEWRLAGLRPANRPERRLMAAAALFTQKTGLAQQWKQLAERNPQSCLEQASQMIRSVDGGYWNHRLAFGGKRCAEPISLVGASRTDAILNNVFIPFLAAVDLKDVLDGPLLDQLPDEADNDIVRQTALSLFGPDHAPSLYRNGLRRQGLIQIFHDFCLNDRSRCAECSLPGLLTG